MTPNGAGTATVLIADDSDAMRALVRITLGAQGWTVLEAGTPTETTEIAQRQRPDIVLLDVVFDGSAEDGFTLCRALKASSVTASIPVIMLSAHWSC